MINTILNLFGYEIAPQRHAQPTQQPRDRRQVEMEQLPTQYQVVNVTERHIRDGQRVSTDSCMVALALADVGITAQVKHHTIMTADVRMIPVPTSISERIVDFDNGYHVAPFSFVIQRERHNLVNVFEVEQARRLIAQQRRQLPAHTQIEVSEDGYHWFTIDQREKVYR